MARKAEGSGKIRADLEGAMLALNDVDEVAPFMKLRIDQALRRYGATDLLTPLLKDLSRIVLAVQEARSQVSTATVRLMEK